MIQMALAVVSPLTSPSTSFALCLPRRLSFADVVMTWVDGWVGDTEGVVDERHSFHDRGKQEPSAEKVENVANTISGTYYYGGP